MSALTDRASVLRQFFRLVNADSEDDDLTAHDDTTLEGAYHLLQLAAWDAQRYLIGCGIGSRWAKTSSALVFTGSDPDRYAPLPSDLLMLDADDDRSGLRSGTMQWGMEIPFEQRFKFSGDRFYIRGNEAASGLEGQLRLYLCVNANPLTGMVADYYYRHATLSDSVTLDLAEDDRELVPAFAAIRATAETWYPGDNDAITLIERKLMFEKEQAWKRARYSRAPKRYPVSPVVGDRWFI